MNGTGEDTALDFNNAPEAITIDVSGAMTGGSYKMQLLVNPKEGTVTVNSYSGSYYRSGSAGANCWNCLTDTQGRVYADWSCRGSLGAPIVKVTI